MAKLSNKEITDDNISSEAIRTLLSECCCGITQMKRRSSFTEQRVLAGSAGSLHGQTNLTDNSG
jgi:hypothetical protein